MARFKLSPQAEEDVIQIVTYLETESAEAAAKVLESLSELFHFLAVNPNSGRLRLEFGTDLRSFVTGSYVVFYRTRLEQVEIVRVLHGARDIATELQ